MLKTHLELFINTLNAINMGIILVNNEQQIIFLNAWMKQHAQFSQNVEGSLLVDVFPEIKKGRIHEAIKSAINHNLASILSQTLNKSPFPLFSSPINRKNGLRMQQAIQVVPIHLADSPRHCLIQINDVSLSVSREKLLRDQSLLLREQSYLDALTGIANRRRFNEYVEDEFRRAKRATSPFSLIMIDVDHFKLYNDYYGHLAGDQCLKQVAMTLIRVIKRPADLLARYGGEEFSAILPDTNYEGANKIAKDMLASIQSLHLEHVRSLTAPYITISIGGTTRTPEENQLVTDLIKVADQALYYAKQTGRNRAIFATNYDD
ncbi:Diguanylate cyclase [Gammaproteobacteria bacterium]